MDRFIYDSGLPLRERPICFLFLQPAHELTQDWHFAFVLAAPVVGHAYRTLAAYAAAWIGMIFWLPPGHAPVSLGFCLVAFAVFYRMHHSLEKREAITVKLARIKPKTKE
jgi:hypothetical protein